jgi:hypothetical protein
MTHRREHGHRNTMDSPRCKSLWRLIAGYLIAQVAIAMAISVQANYRLEQYLLEEMVIYASVSAHSIKQLGGSCVGGAIEPLAMAKTTPLS